MTKLGSIERTPNSEHVEVANALGPIPPFSINATDPEFIATLGVIVSAFVDIGFGISAADLALRAANDNHDLIAIASDFNCERR